MQQRSSASARDAVRGEETDGRPDTLIAHVIIRGGAQLGLGFPSGHAAMAAFTATVAGPYLTRPARIALWVVAFLVAFTRAYIGVHLPLEVIGGPFFGWGAGSLVNLAFGRTAAVDAASADVSRQRVTETERAAQLERPPDLRNGLPRRTGGISETLRDIEEYCEPPADSEDAGRQRRPQGSRQVARRAA